MQAAVSLCVLEMASELPEGLICRSGVFADRLVTGGGQGAAAWRTNGETAEEGTERRRLSMRDEGPLGLGACWKHMPCSGTGARTLIVLDGDMRVRLGWLN